MRRAQRRKYHYIYKTTCKVTGKYYIGMHSTDNLDDGYLGSGKRLWYSIRKYGEENHEIEKLEFFETREKLREREIQIVNEDLINDPLCMNLSLGGGGFINSETSNVARQRGNEKMRWLFENDKEWRERKSKQSSYIMKKNHKEGKLTRFDWTGHKHSEESKRKISEANKGKQNGIKNSQYNTTFVHNLELKKNKRVKKEDVDIWIAKGWIKGAKFKWN